MSLLLLLTRRPDVDQVPIKSLRLPSESTTCKHEGFAWITLIYGRNVTIPAYSIRTCLVKLVVMHRNGRLVRDARSFHEFFARGIDTLRPEECGCCIAAVYQCHLRFVPLSAVVIFLGVRSSSVVQEIDASSTHCARMPWLLSSILTIHLECALHMPFASLESQSTRSVILTVCLWIFHSTVPLEAHLYMPCHKSSIAFLLPALTTACAYKTCALSRW